MDVGESVFCYRYSLVSLRKGRLVRELGAYLCFAPIEGPFLSSVILEVCDNERTCLFFDAEVDVSDAGVLCHWYMVMN